jgi:hypothetical protein
MTTVQPSGMRALTREIADTRSPVRRFLNERFTSGLADVQRDFRSSAPAMVVPTVPSDQANPGTIGGAADWLLRFLTFPHPDAQLAMAGAARYLGPRMMRATAELAARLGAILRASPGPVVSLEPADPVEIMEVSDRLRPVQADPAGIMAFTGPVPGADLDPDLLARGCWALALLTEAFRSMQAATMGPLSRFQGAIVTADDLLGLAPPVGLDQLARFREVYQDGLIPRLADRTGPWVLGPTFAGSALIGGADGDLIAAGLLLELKTTSKLSLPVTDMLQVIGYALLDFDDAYRLDTVGLFNARYSYLVTWDLTRLLGQLSGHPLNITTARDDFRELLLASQRQAL